jgi:hypothetical protein
MESSGCLMLNLLNISRAIISLIKIYRWSVTDYGKSALLVLKYRYGKYSGHLEGGGAGVV